MITKNVFVDIETTGLWSNVHSIIQLAYIIEIDGKVEEEVCLHCQPFPGAQIDARTLTVHGISEADWVTAPTEESLYNDFIDSLDNHINRFQKTDKAAFIAYNAKFDESFIRALFIRHSNKYFNAYFDYPIIDAVQEAYRVLRSKKPTMPDFKLMTVAAELGLKLDTTKLHDALYDIQLTRDIYNRCNQ